MKIIGLGICLLILVSCKQERDHANHNHGDPSLISSNVPDDFLSFYLKFHSDADFQRDNIIFPLKVKADGTSWEKEEWVMHKPFDDHGGQYQQSFLNMNGLIIETISDGTGMYKMERRFVKSDNSYNLIYFEVVNAFENSEDWQQEESSS